MMRLQGNNIDFGYSKSKKILDNVTVSIDSEELVGLLAPSGYGKTTLAKVLSGYLKPQKGSVTLEGHSEENKDNGYNPVQLIFQHPEMAVNPLWKMERTLKETGPISKPLMEAMGIDESWLNRWPSELSGGELQRFCVLRILNPQTRFIIADEMTTMLDAITQAQIWNVVVDYAKTHQIGILVISHSKALVERICHRVIEL